MKKIYGIIYSVVFVLVLAACSKEALVENKGAEPSPEEEVKYIDVTFGAEFPVPAELQGNAVNVAFGNKKVSCNNLSFNNSVAQLCIHVLGKRGPGTTSLNGVIGVCAEKITISYR